jgi:hypothetical protein
MKLLFSRLDLSQEAAACFQGPDVLHSGAGVRIVSLRASPAVEARDISAKLLGHLHPTICFSCDFKALTDGLLLLRFGQLSF